MKVRRSDWISNLPEFERCGQVIELRIVIPSRLRGHFRFVWTGRPFRFPLPICKLKGVEEIFVQIEFHARVSPITDGLSRCRFNQGDLSEREPQAIQGDMVL